MYSDMFFMSSSSKLAKTALLAMSCWKSASFSLTVTSSRKNSSTPSSPPPSPR